MSHYLNVTADANRDLEQASSWYNEKQAGLGDRFVLAVREKFEVILRWPELPRAVGRKSIRKVRIPRSPYSIYYRILGEKIQIVAIVHGARDPNYLNYRLR
ncbi:MAG: type II toxin-antitoxin system RelE/ParE family toxin [Verrucomicrobiota bacterium]